MSLTICDVVFNLIKRIYLELNDIKHNLSSFLDILSWKCSISQLEVNHFTSPITALLAFLTYSSKHSVTTCVLWMETISRWSAKQEPSYNVMTLATENVSLCTNQSHSGWWFYFFFFQHSEPGLIPLVEVCLLRLKWEI